MTNTSGQQGIHVQHLAAAGSWMSLTMSITWSTTSIALISPGFTTPDIAAMSSSEVGPARSEMTGMGSVRKSRNGLIGAVLLHLVDDGTDHVAEVLAEVQPDVVEGDFERAALEEAVAELREGDAGELVDTLR